MTLQEFTQLTGVKVSNDEYWAINEVYNNSEVTKQEFCQIWCRINSNRVAEAKAKAKKEAQKDSIRNKVNPILLKIEKQIDKYNRAGEIFNAAVLTEKEKNFLLKNNLVCENSFECSAGTLLMTIKTNLKCI
ncbi:MAG: hypothetical protein U0O22_00900 [Acutalibacteraceae bacterium]